MMVIGGVVGGYVGYWIGDLLGLSTDADWPFRIGGGVGAIALSIGLAAVGVLATAAVLAWAGRSGKGHRRAAR